MSKDGAITRIHVNIGDNIKSCDVMLDKLEKFMAHINASNENKKQMHTVHLHYVTNMKLTLPVCNRLFAGNQRSPH